MFAAAAGSAQAAARKKEEIEKRSDLDILKEVEGVAAERQAIRDENNDDWQKEVTAPSEYFFHGGRVVRPVDFLHLNIKALNKFKKKGMPSKEKLVVDEDDHRDVVRLSEIIVYILFLLFFTFDRTELLYSGDQTKSFFLTNSVRDNLIDQPFLHGTFGTPVTFEDIASTSDLWRWFDTVYMGTFFPETQNNGQPVNPLPFNSQWTHVADHNLVLGAARILQMRVSPSVCKLPDAFFDTYENSCYPPFSSSVEAKHDIVGSSSGKVYQWTDAETNGVQFPQIGQSFVYSGSGYSVILPMQKDETAAIIAELQADNFLDQATRAVFIDFTLYNVQHNLFCSVRLMLEFMVTGSVAISQTLATGDVLRYDGEYEHAVIAVDIIFVIFVAYFFFEEIRTFRKHEVDFEPDVEALYKATGTPLKPSPKKNQVMPSPNLKDGETQDIDKMMAEIDEKEDDEKAEGQEDDQDEGKIKKGIRSGASLSGYSMLGRTGTVMENDDNRREKKRRRKKLPKFIKTPLPPKRYPLKRFFVMVWRKLKVHFMDAWNWLGVINLAMFVLTIAVRMHILTDTRDIILPPPYNQYRPDLYYMAYTTQIERLATGVNGFLLYFKLFKYLRFNSRLQQLSGTMRVAWKSVATLMIIFFFIWFGYALMGFLAYGNSLNEFRSIPKALFTLLRALLGDIDAQELLDTNRLYGWVFFFIYIMLFYLFMLNMFLAIVNDAYNQYRTDQKLHREFRVKIPRRLRDMGDKIIESLSKKADADGDNLIDEKEAQDWLDNNLEMKAVFASGAHLVQAFDKDKSGMLDEDEFACAKAYGHFKLHHEDKVPKVAPTAVTEESAELIAKQLAKLLQK